MAERNAYAVNRSGADVSSLYLHKPIRNHQNEYEYSATGAYRLSSRFLGAILIYKV